MEQESRQKPNSEFWQKVITDPLVRKALARENHFLFFLMYFNQYVTYELAFFHKEMLRMVEDETRLTVVMAFRGSGKSTIMNLSAVLWSIVGKKQKMFVIISSKTRAQARMHFENIKQELENNELLRSDLGPFKETADDWGSYMLDIPDFGAKIMCISAMQSMRGLRHGIHRPDLIILDDVEDMGSVQHEQNRDRLYGWFMSEVLPSGNEKTQVIVLGNLLHIDSLLMRLKKDIDEKMIDGTFRAYPLWDDNKKILWPGRFRGEDDIKALEKTVSDHGTWCREYLLTIGPSITYMLMVFRKKDPLIALKKAYEERDGIQPKPKIEPPRNGYGYVISAPITSPECKYLHQDFRTGEVTDPERPELGVIEVREPPPKVDWSKRHSNTRPDNTDLEASN